jgi:lipopolysaccharide assembly protein A
MRWIHLTVIVLFAAVVIIFALQNLRLVPVSFLGFGLNVPVAVLVAVAYLLGAATGSSLLALLRRSYAGSRRIGSTSTTGSRGP